MLHLLIPLYVHHCLDLTPESHVFMGELLGLNVRSFVVADY